MPKLPKDTITYDLKRGKKVVYRGTTDDPERREQEHRDEGKRFGHFLVTSRRMTEEGAKKKEAEALKQYRQSHKGKNPSYNKDDDG